MPDSKVSSRSPASPFARLFSPHPMFWPGSPSLPRFSRLFLLPLASHRPSSLSNYFSPNPLLPILLRTMQFCPTCGNHLLVGRMETAQGGNRFYCSTCPYQFPIEHWVACSETGCGTNLASSTIGAKANGNRSTTSSAEPRRGRATSRLTHNAQTCASATGPAHTLCRCRSAVRTSQCRRFTR